MVVRRLSEVEQLPDWAPSFVKNAWELARSGLDPGLEEEAQALTDLDHPEFAPLRELGDEVPPDFQVEGVKPRLHMILHRVIEQQLITADPPEARTAMAHLLALGVDRHAAVHLLSGGLVKDIHTALRHEKPSGYVPFLQRLSQGRLPGDAPKPTAGRNDPCPCGSGKKYKKCCGAEGPAPLIDLRPASMVLGEGMYTDADLHALPPSHPLVALENLGAVAHALAEAGAVTVARQAYRQLAVMAAAFEEPVRSEVLQECLEFAATLEQS